MSTEQAAAITSDLPLVGLTVLDLTQARAGPTCARHLADWGADVITIQPAKASGEDQTGKRDGHDYQNLHRNKRMIRLDLKSTEGHAVFMAIAAKADVVLENFRPDVKKRLRISWDDVQKVNPAIVYGSISGFGQEGPYANRPGVDQIAQGMGGLMSITGMEGQGPVRVGIAINDLTAGNLLALGVMMALYQRQKTGKGRWIYTSLLESQIFMLDFQASRWLMKSEVAGQTGNDHPTGAPTGAYPTSDGYVNIGAAAGALWLRFCDALRHPEWKNEPGWEDTRSRGRDRKRLNAVISEVTALKSSNYWVALLGEAGVPCGPIYAIDQVFADPQVRALEMTPMMKSESLGDKPVVGSPLNFAGSAREVRLATRAAAGADTDAVLAEFGYQADEIEALRRKSVI